MDRNVALLRRAFEILQTGDLDACQELLTEDFIANLPGLPEPLPGRDAWRLGVQSMFVAFPDLGLTIEDIFGAGDRVAVRLRFHGTHQGPFQSIPPTGRAVTFTSVEIYRVAGELIAEEWVSPDLMGLMRQLTSD